MGLDWDGSESRSERELQDGTSDQPRLTRRSAIRMSGAALAASAFAAGISAPSAPARASPMGTATDSGAGFNVKSFGARGNSDPTGSSGTDDTAAIQAALDQIKAIGGGVLLFPKGYYRTSAFLRIAPNTIIRGEGRFVSQIVCNHAGGGGTTPGQSMCKGSGLVTSSTINSSSPIHVAIEDLGIVNSNPSNVGAAFYDTCGTYIALRNAALLGFKYGAVLDQSELVDVDLCEIAGQNSGGAGVWIVNGSDLSPGAIGTFSNRISIKRCQINQAGNPDSRTRPRSATAEKREITARLPLSK